MQISKRILHQKRWRPGRTFHFKSFSTSPKADDTRDDYKLSRKQRRALRLTQEEQNLDPTEKLTHRLQEMKEEAMIQDLDRQEKNPIPWQNLLVYPSRALWRSSPNPPPAHLLDTQAKIIKASERTSKQLKRTWDRIVANHLAISELRERERRKMVNGAGYSANSLAAKQQKGKDRAIKPVYYNPEQSISSLKYRLETNYNITKRVLQECQSLLGKDVFQPKRILDVGIGAGSASAAALELLNGRKDVMDNSYGYNGVEWLHGIDPSQSMRDASGIMLSTLLEEQSHSNKSRKGSTRLTFGDSILSSGRSDVAQSGGTFDLALCSYTLHEIPSVPASLSMAAIVWEKLAPAGVAIFIEPGTPDGFNALRSIRSMLLDVCPPVSTENEDGDEECHVIAPCTHNGTCPMIRHQKNFFRKKMMEEEAKMQQLAESLEEDDDEDDFDDVDDEDDEIEVAEDVQAKENFSGSETDVFDTAFCSFVHGMPGSTKKKQGEKFSYLVVQKRIHDKSGETSYEGKNPFKDTNIVDMLKQSLRHGKNNITKVGNQTKSHLDIARDIEDKFLDSSEDSLGLELVRGKNRESFGRIIRAPIKRRGHVTIDYCTSAFDDEEGIEEGKIIRSKVSKSQSTKGAPGLYVSARKGRWGGFWADLSEK